MSSPFDQDAQSPPLPASDWPTQPSYPPPAASTPTTPSYPPPAASAPTNPSYPPPAPPAPPTATTAASPWQPAPATPPVWRAQPAGPPMGPPPVPPGSPHGVPAPGPAPRRRSGLTSSGSRIGLVVALVVALVIGATAGGVASRAILTAATDSASAPPAPTAPSTGATTPSTSPGTGSSSGTSGSGSGSTSGSSGQMASWSDVVDAVRVGVVNIESRMSGGVGAGTGMVLTADGEVLTNNHVVEGASAIVVTVVETGKSYRASIVGRDPQQDVAVLRMQDATGLSTIPLGDSSAVEVGDQVAAIGNAGGKGGEPSVATGRVTALDQQITASDEDGSNAETLTGMIQVDANVVPGDSGGPLADASGRVIGMNSAAAVGAGGGAMRFRGGSSGSGEGYAIPIDKALRIAEDLKASGKGASAADGSVTSGSGGFLGVQVQEGTQGGADVVAVESGSPADRAGLAAGDVIVGVDGTEVVDPSALVSILSGHQPGDRVTVTYVGSDGRTHQATATLGSK